MHLSREGTGIASAGCKEGKTHWGNRDAEDSCRTSEKDVEFHLSNAIRKELGGCNRITEVVIGISAGIFHCVRPRPKNWKRCFRPSRVERQRFGAEHAPDNQGPGGMQSSIGWTAGCWRGNRVDNTKWSRPSYSIRLRLRSGPTLASYRKAESRGVGRSSIGCTPEPSQSPACGTVRAQY